MEAQVAALTQQVADLTAQLVANAERQASLEDQLRTAQQTAAARAVGVDTKLLGRPDVFEKEDKWQDWSTVFRAYGGLLGPEVGPGLRAAEDLGQNVGLTHLNPERQAASRALQFALTMLCRGEALAIIQNSGDGEGFLSWRRLCARYEPANRARLAGQLLVIMKWNFSGDIQTKVEQFERAVLSWEKKAGEVISTNVRIGILLNCLDDTNPLKEHLVMNSSRFTKWQEIKDEVINIRRTQAAFQGPQAMEVDALQKKGPSGKGKDGGGGKGAGKPNFSGCWNCGAKDHLSKDCPYPRYAGGGKGAGKGKGYDTGKGKGKDGGKAGKGKGKSSLKCFNCGGTGHTAAQCPSARIHELAEGEQWWSDDYSGYGYDQWWTDEHQQQEQEPETAEPQGEGDIGGLFVCPLDVAGLDQANKAGCVTIGVDSCAAVSVLPTRMCEDYPLKIDAQAGTRYMAANGAAIVDHGGRTLYGSFDDSKGASSAAGANFRVADVSRPLMAVSDMLDKGCKVIFERDQNGANISRVIAKNGSHIPMYERKKTFEIHMRLQSPPFHRPGQ